MESYAYSSHTGDHFAAGMIQDFDQQQQRGATSSQQFMVSVLLDSHCLPSHHAWLTDCFMQQDLPVLPNVQRLADQPFSGDCLRLCLSRSSYVHHSLLRLVAALRLLLSASLYYEVIWEMLMLQRF